MRITALLALTITLTACGLQEDASQPPADDGTSDTDANDTDATDAPDAGTSTTTPDAGTPAPDASTPDAGTPPAPDAGAPAPTPDAGTPTPTPDAGTPPAPDAGSPPDAGTTPTYLPDPVSSPSSLHLLFADYYMSGSPCGDVKGNLPGTNWNDDYTGLLMQDTNADGYLELTLSATPAGTYDVTYRDRECSGQPQMKAWAHFGEKDMIRQMRTQAKQFLQCNWWNGTAEVTVSSPGCNIRLSIDGNGLITGAGNMANYQ